MEPICEKHGIEGCPDCTMVPKRRFDELAKAYSDLALRGLGAGEDRLREAASELLRALVKEKVSLRQETYAAQDALARTIKSNFDLSAQPSAPAVCAVCGVSEAFHHTGKTASTDAHPFQAQPPAPAVNYGLNMQRLVADAQPSACPDGCVDGTVVRMDPMGGGSGGDCPNPIHSAKQKEKP